MKLELKKKVKSKILLSTIFLFSILTLVAIVVPTVLAEKPCEGTTIQDGTILYSPGHYLGGEPLKVGYDIFGYNYQAHTFKGSYANVYLGRDGLPPYEGDDEAYLTDNPGADDNWFWPYRGIKLLMKWNDAWLSNKDCDDDGELDRHYGYDSYIGSGAWLTNHQWGTDTDIDGKEYHWNYFVKIVAVPADAELIDGYWYTADGTEIGSEIWGEFAIIQQVDNDPSMGWHGISYLSPASAGFGYYK